VSPPINVYLEEKDICVGRVCDQGAKEHYRGVSIIKVRKENPMGKRKIIIIDEEKCNGCGACIPNCPEGAIQMIDQKARLVSDLFCDGLGACIGHCPQGAIAIEEREAEAYDERKVMANIVAQGKNVIKAHLEHLKSHGQKDFLQHALEYLREEKVEIPLQEFAPSATEGASCGLSREESGCPGSRMMDFRKERKISSVFSPQAALGNSSELRQWPVQLMLVPGYAPYLENADLLIAADCVPFAYADFHGDLLKGKALLVGCPKFDDLQVYREKISQILQCNSIKSLTYAHMEVPCCFGLIGIITQAIADSGKDIPFREVVISIQGEKIKDG